MFKVNHLLISNRFFFHYKHGEE